MKESTDERETKTSKSGVSSSDLAVEYDDERGVKNDGRLGRRHGSDVSTRRTGCRSTELQLKLWLKKEKKRPPHISRLEPQTFVTSERRAVPMFWTPINCWPNARVPRQSQPPSFLPLSLSPHIVDDIIPSRPGRVLSRSGADFCALRPTLFHLNSSFFRTVRRVCSEVIVRSGVAPKRLERQLSNEKSRISYAKPHRMGRLYGEHSISFSDNGPFSSDLADFI